MAKDRWITGEKKRWYQVSFTISEAERAALMCIARRLGGDESEAARMLVTGWALGWFDVALEEAVDGPA